MDLDIPNLDLNEPYDKEPGRIEENRNLKDDSPTKKAPQADGKKKKSTCVKITAFLMSEVGLLIVVVVYVVLGGLLFQAIELPDEDAAAEANWVYAKWIANNQTKMKDELLAITKKAVAGDPAIAASGKTAKGWATLEYKKLLDKHQSRIIAAVQQGYDGEVHGDKTKYDSSFEEFGWNLPSAILFAATILTTIGYGHISPKSEVGRLVCIVYGLMAVPLMSIFLMRVGAAVARFTTMLYNKLTCYICSKKRKTKLTDEFDPPFHSQKRNKNKKPKKRQTVPQEELSIRTTPYEHTLSDDEFDYDTAEVPKMKVVLIVVIYLLFGALVFHLTEEGWSMVNSFYCCFVTLTTLGFGDLVPGVKDPNGFWGVVRLLFASLYIMVGLALLGMFIDLLSAGAVGGDGEDEEGEEEGSKVNEQAPPPMVAPYANSDRPTTNSTLGDVEENPPEQNDVYNNDLPEDVAYPPAVKQPPDVDRPMGADTAGLVEHVNNITAGQMLF